MPQIQTESQAKSTTKGQATRQKIIDAAEVLFGNRGIEAVSMREIAATAGLRNVAGVQYHFGSKDALIVAISDSRAGLHADRRIDMLTKLKEARSKPDRVAIIRAIVEPYLERLDQGEQEQAHLLFSEKVMIYSRTVLRTISTEAPDRSFSMGVGMLREQLTHLSDAEFQRRLRFMTQLTVTAAADRVRQSQRGHQLKESNLQFIRSLIDSVTGIFST